MSGDPGPPNLTGAGHEAKSVEKADTGQGQGTLMAQRGKTQVFCSVLPSSGAMASARRHQAQGQVTDILMLQVATAMPQVDS